ncbi:MAG: 50S ribosomal protein L29 [Candidatus Peribacteraceae bacterium]
MSTTLSMIELRRLTLDEVRKELALSRFEYAKVRMHVHTQSEKNHAKVKSLRRQIARMEMALSEMRASSKATEATPTPKSAAVKKKTSKKTVTRKAVSVSSVPKKK